MKRETNMLIAITLALVLIGIMMVYSTGSVKEPSGHLFKSHVVYAALGLAAMFGAARFDYHGLRAPELYRLLVSFEIILLLLVLIPGIGIEAYGAQRWLRLLNFGFQPSEFAKFAVIILLAVKLTENQDHIKSFTKGFLPPIAIAGFFAFLIVLERDLGVPVVIMSVAFLMVFIAGAHWLHCLLGVIPAGATVAVMSLVSPYRLERLLAYLDPWKHRDDEGFQLIQSMAAFARGSIWGRGPGASEQKLFYLPASHTDFIFAIWGEETGLVGSLALVSLYTLLMVVALHVAICARDLFGTLLAAGITCIITFQGAFIMAVTTGLLPTKGLPLPFVSYGGTALITFLAMMGVLISVARQGREPEQEAGPQQGHVLQTARS